MNKTTRTLNDASITPKGKYKPKPTFTVRVLPPVDGATLALAKMMQAAHDFDEAVWSGRVVAPHLEHDRHD